MAFGKKKNRDTEDPTTRDIPYMTNKKTLDSYGIYPVRGRSMRSMKWQRRILMGFLLSLIGFLIFSTVTSIFSGGKVSGLADAVEQNKSPAFKSRYESLGESIITSYFSGKTPPVNLLMQANWPNMASPDEAGGTNAAAQGTGRGSGGGQPVIVEDLSLIEGYETPFDVSGSSQASEEDLSAFTNPVNEVLRYSGTIDGRQYEFGVYLIIPDIDDTSKLPYLVSPPTIMPMRTLVSADIEGSKPTDMEMFSEVELNTGTLDVINKWASAYAQGDSAAIKSYTGDGRVEASYQGVGGFTLMGTPTVEWSYLYTDQTDDVERIVARVSFMMSSEISRNSISDSASNDLTDSSSTGNNQFTPVQVMDLMLGNFEEGVADILAWGPGGMWQTLTPRMNSIVPVIQEGEAEITSDTETTTSNQPGTSTTTTNTDSPITGIPGAPTLSDDSETSTRTRESSSEEDTSTTRRQRSSGSETSSRSSRGSSRESSTRTRSRANNDDGERSTQRSRATSTPTSGRGED